VIIFMPNGIIEFFKRRQARTPGRAETAQPT
jgi:hypothetical protein